MTEYNSETETVTEKIVKNIIDEYQGENTIIETNNGVIQISTLEEQRDNSDPKVSSIDLGDCEKRIKDKANLTDADSLIIVKTDIKNTETSSIYVQYEVYHPVSKVKLDLDICNDVKITVNVPVDLDSKQISLYDSLSEYGYNLFDSADDFYNDVCSVYTSENGTDMTLEDRKKEIFGQSGNVTMCQIGCEFKSYNKTTKKAKCDCDVQIQSTETNITKIDFSPKDIASSFLNTLTNSNFLVLKCYKLAFNFENILKNKGRIIMSIIFISFIILIIIYLIKDKKKIKEYITNIIKNRMTFNTQKKPNNKMKTNSKQKSKKDNKKNIEKKKSKFAKSKKEKKNANNQNNKKNENKK